MNNIFLIGDIHTANAFRICGVESIAADRTNAEDLLKELIKDMEPVIILITKEIASSMPELLKKVNFESPDKVILEIPGIDDTEGLGKSLTGYIAEALGIAL